MLLRCHAWTFATTGVLAIATIFFIVAFATPAWVLDLIEAEDVELHQGIWQICRDRFYPKEVKCSFYDPMPAYFQVTRIVMCITAVSIILDWVFFIIGLTAKDISRNRFYVILNSVLFLVTALLLLIAAANTAMNGPGGLSYSFYCSVFTLILFIIAAVTRIPDSYAVYTQDLPN